MKIQNEKELQQVTFHHSSDIDFKNIVNLQKVSWKTIPFLSE